MKRRLTSVEYTVELFDLYTSFEILFETLKSAKERIDLLQSLSFVRIT